MVKRILTFIGILLAAALVIIMVCIAIVGFLFGGFDKDYSVSDLKENFEKNKNEIIALKKYYNSIVPKNKFVEIEFDNDHKLSRFGIQDIDPVTRDANGAVFLEWKLKINTERMDSIIKPLGWTRETLKTLKEKLDQANCIQIESGEPAKIGFKRSGMGMYFFNVFDNPIPPSQRERYNDSCTYILANDKLVLEYGGGAIGNQCFYNKE